VLESHGFAALTSTGGALTLRPEWAEALRRFPLYIYIYTSIATRPGAPDGEQLWDTELRRIDALLEDEVLIERVEEALCCRRPKSRGLGRPGIGSSRS